MHLIYELQKDHIDQLHELFQNEWWTSGRSFDDTRKCLQNSQIVIGAINAAGVLQGFVRVLTDYVFKAMIFDLIVSDERRGAGVGQLLMKAVVEHELLRNVAHFELYCLPALQPYYEQQGFGDELGGIVLMRRS